MRMRGDPDPVVHRRRLTAVLRRLRTDNSLTQMEVAKDLEWSHSKVVRIENGDVGIGPTDLRALLRYYRVDDQQQVDELLAMARASRQQRFTEYADVLSRDFLRYLRYEASARVVRQYEPNVVPGLLQTPDYMYAVLRAVNPTVPENVLNRRMDARAKRQEQMFSQDDRPELHIIVDEAALRRNVGAEHNNVTLMTDQLAHIQRVGKQPGIKIQVVLFAAGAHPGLAGPFTVLEFSDPTDDNLLYLEYTRGDITTRDDQEEMQRHLDMFFTLQRMATRPENLSTVIEAIARDLRAAPAGA